MNIMRLSDITSEIGFMLLTHGAEIHRVEDTICRIAQAYGARADVFAIPASLVMTITGEDGHSFTQTRRVYYRDTNLDRVDALNMLARRLCRETPPDDVATAWLGEIHTRPSYTLRQQLAAAALGAGAFALLFGGDVAEALCAVLAGLLVRLVGSWMEKTGGGLMLQHIVGGAICALVPGAAALLYPALDNGVVTISALMLLVPGLIMTNSMRDLIAGDLVTGVMKVAEATLIATGIAIGVMCSLSLWRVLPGVTL